MNLDPVIKNVRKHISLSPGEEENFLSLLKPLLVSRKQYVLRESEICTSINFVLSGTMRAYYLDKEGRESTIMFAVTDWWITDMYCFVNRLPAMLNIQATEDSVVLQLRKDDLDRLFEKIPTFEKFFRILMQNAYIREQLRVIESLSLTAAERYDNFLRKYPQIIGQVTQKEIASYLGITPEFLSAIRAKKRGPGKT